MNETAYSSRYRFVIGGFVVWAQFTPGLSILAVAPILPRITDEYGLTHATASLLIGVVAIVQALSSIPAGVIVGRIGVWRTYSISWLLMGTAVLSAVAPGFYTLLALRIVLGVGMAGILPAAGPLIMQWFRARERPVVSGFSQAGLSLGTMVAVASAVPLADVIGCKGPWASLGPWDSRAPWPGSSGARHTKERWVAPRPWHGGRRGVFWRGRLS